MNWQALDLDSTLAETVAAAVVAAAGKPETWTLENFGSQVYRVRQGDRDRFYFSPRACAVLGDLIAAHAGVPCAPPLSKSLTASCTSRLLLGFKPRWEPLKPPRQVPAPKGAAPKPDFPREPGALSGGGG